MGRVQLYIAQSLDGFIADADGGVEWLEAFNVEGQDHGYAAFLSDVAAVVMGGNTYAQAMSWDIPWPYQGLPSWVLTHRELPLPHAADVRLTQGPVAAVVEEIERETSGNIWLVGGADLVRQFLEAGLIHELTLFIAPVLLGTGIPLFGGAPPSQARLTGTREWGTGLVELRYQLGG
jgi:dihydrofolate reductase